MAVTVGTDVYLSVADADTYWSVRNNTTWSAASTAVKEAALREATQYIDANYEFIGQQKVENPLVFPRHDVEIENGNFRGNYYNDQTIPPMIKNACAELALLAISARLEPPLARGGAVKREKIDVIEVEYMDSAPGGTSYSYVNKLLKPLLASGKNTRKLARS